MESEISTLFTTLITKVHNTLESLLLEQKRTNEVISKLIKDNQEKDNTIRQLEDLGKEISVPSDGPNNSRKP